MKAALDTKVFRPEGAARSWDPRAARRDFPLLGCRMRGKPLVYLDNAATTQKPGAVIEATDRYYRQQNANIHRGLYALSEEATQAYEGARAKVCRFLNAAEAREIVFVRGTTEAINLAAQSFGRSRFGAGDEVLLTAMEHHSNIVPWQLVCGERGARLRVVPVGDAGEVDPAAFEGMITERTKLVAAAHVSNVLGTVNPVRQMIAAAHRKGVPVLLDGAQAVSHLPVDVRELDCDFYAFSGHKLFGPTGIGVLYGKARHLEEMPPYQGGGDMIRSVSFERTSYNTLPYKFEAGTPNIAGAIGLGAALDYLEALPREEVGRYEQELLAYGTDLLRGIPGLRVIGTASEKVSVLSFTLKGIHPHDIGTVVDQEGVAIRAGHHCAQPLMERFGIPATARASLAFYNTREDWDTLAAALRKVVSLFC
jgi:cysteine desulfurase/selenocysteine lyase